MKQRSALVILKAFSQHLFIGTERFGFEYFSLYIYNIWWVDVRIVEELISGKVK